MLNTQIPRMNKLLAQKKRMRPRLRDMFQSNKSKQKARVSLGLAQAADLCNPECGFQHLVVKSSRLFGQVEKQGIPAL